ncbi:MAG: hypothetical protein GY788_07560 [bacterium]|nr:hypothetical protein [bacterium]
MDRPVVVEKTEAEVIAQSTSRVFRRVQAKTGVIPAAYDGKYVVAALIAINTDATQAQMDGFEVDVEGITGVYNCDILSGPHRIPVDRVPADHDLRILLEAGFDIRPTPVEE